MDRSGTGQGAGVEVKLRDGKSPGVEVPVALFQVSNLVGWRFLQTRKREMGREVPLLGGDAGFVQRLFHLLLQLQERCALFQAHPEDPWLLPGREMADPPERQGEGRTCYLRERRPDRIEHLIVNFADEPEGKMELLTRHMARPRQVPADGGNRVLHFLRQIN